MAKGVRVRGAISGGDVFKLRYRSTPKDAGNPRRLGVFGKNIRPILEVEEGG